MVSSFSPPELPLISHIKGLYDLFFLGSAEILVHTDVHILRDPIYNPRDQREGGATLVRVSPGTQD
jgi:hypothetical protein